MTRHPLTLVLRPETHSSACCYCQGWHIVDRDERIVAAGNSSPQDAQRMLDSLRDPLQSQSKWSEQTVSRDARTGRIGHAFDTLCACGHPMGVHSHTGQSCMAADDPDRFGEFAGNNDVCACEGFVKARKRR